jgi:membrane protein implicated in regulation of membrane protease activity
MTYTFVWLIAGLVFILLHAFLSAPVLFLAGLSSVYTALFVGLGLDRKLLQVGAFVVNLAAFYGVYVYLFRKQLKDKSEVGLK